MSWPQRLGFFTLPLSSSGLISPWCQGRETGILWVPRKQQLNQATRRERQA